MFIQPKSTGPFIIAVSLVLSVIYACGHKNKEESPAQSLINEYISEIKFDSLGSVHPEITKQIIEPGLVKVNVSFQLKDSLKQDDWKVTITPAFTPGFHWAPHLTPSDTNIIAQHVFRSPALIMADTKKQIVIVPDLDLIKKNNTVKWYMDMDAQRNKMTIGVSNAAVGPHVLYEKKKGQVIPPGIFEFGFYIMLNDDPVSLADPWRKPLAFLWSKWGKPLYDAGEPIKGSLQPYVNHTYNWAFNTWKKNVWQEFELNGKKVGAPVFIVNVTQSPNYPGKVNEREFRSIWNQAWFNSLRSAQGLYRYARRTNDTELLKKAEMTKELALSFPQQDGLFPGVIATPMETIKVNGEELNRSTGWAHYYFGNSNRNPVSTWEGTETAPLHILDMSWTAYLMLTWYDELEKDDRLIQYATRYADKLVTLQDTEGFFPAWLDAKTKKPLGVLDQSPETSMSVTFLLKLSSLTKNKKYEDAAIKALDAVSKKIIPVGQWEDFETYWSCSRILDSLVNKKITRNDQYKQNTLSIYWTAEALYNAYKITGDKKYLSAGQRVLDEMLMFQASWQPPFIVIHALGGFGVMNGDGEWNDSRQSLFAELIIQYGKELKNEEYIERGTAALKASFVMMYCPENPATKEQWEKVYPFFNEKDYGFMMENYGHIGETDNNGLGIGEFTIYDWGNGAAAEAYNRVTDHYSDVLR
ncbi:MAG: hypothetical protein WDO19_14580 [Bacteroidota bacterium]